MQSQLFMLLWMFVLCFLSIFYDIRIKKLSKQRKQLAITSDFQGFDVDVSPSGVMCGGIIRLINHKKLGPDEDKAVLMMP